MRNGFGNVDWISVYMSGRLQVIEVILQADESIVTV